MKKFVALLLVIVLTATVAIGGTIAYLQDTARNDNTMTLGNVDIEQWEFQRVKANDGTYETETIDEKNSYVLEGFEQDKMLLPCTELAANGNPYNHGAGGWDATIVRMTQVGSHGSMQVFTSKNAQDKFVIVENTGSIDAYVRTIVAIEHGTVSAALIGSSSRATTDASDAGEGTPWFANVIGTVEINGTNYYVFEFVYEGAKTSSGYKHENGVLPAGEKTYPSLCQVYMTYNATNDDVIKLDGNSNGKLDILVLSQAVQADGWNAIDGKTIAQTALDAAFGKVDAKNVAEWFAASATNP